MEEEELGFIGEPIEVEFDQAPALEKVPDCPDRFVWRGQVYHVVEMLREWHDYRRRGHMARNMALRHLETARRRGSWGVGRDYFRVRTCVAGSTKQTADSRPPTADSSPAGSAGGSSAKQEAMTGEAPDLAIAGRIFELYYDRAPSAGSPKGGWFLYREVSGG